MKEGLQAEQEALIDLSGASRAFGLSRSRLYQLATSGQIPSVQINGRGKLLFRRSDIEALLQPRAKSFSPSQGVANA